MSKKPRLELPPGIEVQDRKGFPHWRCGFKPVQYEDPEREEWIYQIAADHLIRFMTWCSKLQDPRHVADQMDWMSMDKPGCIEERLRLWPGGFLMPRDAGELFSLLKIRRPLFSTERLEGVVRDRLSAITTPICPCDVSKFAAYFPKELESVRQALHQYMQIETITAKFGAHWPLETNPAKILEGLNDLIALPKGNRIRNQVRESVGLSRVVKQAPANLMFKTSLIYAAQEAVSTDAPQDVRLAVIRAMDLTPACTTVFRLVGGHISKYLGPKDFKAVIKAFEDLEEVTLGLSLSGDRILATQAELLVAVSQCFGGEEETRQKVGTMEAVYRTWGGSRESLDFLIRRATTNPTYFLAMGVQAVKNELMDRDRAGGVGGLLLREIPAKPKKGGNRTDEELLVAIRALYPEVIGPYLDGTSHMTCGEVCARLLVFAAHEEDGIVEEVWQDVLDNLKKFPRHGWKRLAQDACKVTPRKRITF